VSEEIAKRSTKCRTIYKGAPIRSVTGQVNIKKEIEIEVLLNDLDDKVLINALIVNPFHHDVLLGNDFNALAGAVIDYNEKKVKFHPPPLRTSNMVQQVGNSDVKRVYSRDKVIIEPGKTLDVQILLENASSIRDYYVYTIYDYNPCLKEEPVTFQCKIPLAIILTNLTGEIVKLFPGSTLALYSPILSNRFIWKIDREDVDSFEERPRPTDNTATLEIGGGHVDVSQTMTAIEIGALSRLLNTFIDRFAFSKDNL